MKEGQNLSSETRSSQFGGDFQKGGLVREMFDKIAPVYDLLNHILSLGMDFYWRKKLSEELLLDVSEKVLDLATGSADQAISILSHYPSIELWALDFSKRMLFRAARKLSKKKDELLLVQGNIEKLPFPDHFFSCASIAFGVRNLEDIEKGLAEVRRVLKPKGKLAILEFSLPSGRFFSTLYKFYLGFFVPLLGKLISGQNAYYYLRDSISSFPQPEEFIKILERFKFKKMKLCSLSFGIVHLYIFYKQDF